MRRTVTGCRPATVAGDAVSAAVGDRVDDDRDAERVVEELALPRHRLCAVAGATTDDPPEAIHEFEIGHEQPAVRRSAMRSGRRKTSPTVVPG